MELLTAPKNTAKHVVLKVLSVIGALTVIIGIAWVGIRGLSLFPNVGSFLANAIAGVRAVFVPAERIIISTVDSQIVANKPFTLNWEHRGKAGSGMYTFSYECRDNVFLATMNAGARTTIFCDTEAPVGEATQLSLVAIGAVEDITEVPVTVTYKKNGSVLGTVQGNARIMVQAQYLDTGTSTTTTDTTSAPDTSSDAPTGTTGATQPVRYMTVPVITQPLSDPNGDIDLVVRVLDYGLVDRSTGVFTEKDELPRRLPSGTYAAIRFEVKNIGTKESGEWEFEAELPTSPSYTYKADDQQSLFPGDKITYTLGFDRVRNADEDDFTITVDPDDDIDESNERNNEIDGTVEIDR